MSHAAVMVTGKRFIGIELSGPTLDGARTVTAEPDGAHIAAKLRAEGWTATHVTLVVPRHRVLARRLTVASGTTEEVDQMIGVQLERELDLPLDEVRYAYTTASHPDGTLDVNVAALRIDDLESYRELLKPAGLAIESVVVTSWCPPVTLVGRLPEGATGVALLEPDYGEVLLLDGRTPRASRSMEVGRDGGMAAELIRTLPALEAQTEIDPVGEVLVFGKHHESSLPELADAWKAMRTTKVACVEPAAGAIDPIFVPVLGAALSRVKAGKPAGPDLLEVRVKPSRWKPHMRKLIVAGVAAGFMLLWGCKALVIGMKESDLKEVEAEIARDAKLVEELRAMEAHSEVLDQWSRPRVSWAWALGAVLECERASAPGPYDRDLYVTDVTMSHAEEAGTRRKKQEVLRVVISGRAKKEEDVMKLTNLIRNKPGVLKAPLPNLDPPDKEPFPIPFRITLTLSPGAWTHAGGGS